MALYQDGILISGANTLPQLTLAEYNALPADQRPTYWERLDGDYDDVLADKTDIATVESGTTASRAYSVGELVYVSGTLYRVKTAIASGATFTVGTNVEVTNVSESIASISGGEVSPDYTALSLNVEYTCPSDGYATVGCINNASSYAQLQIGLSGIGIYVYGTTAGYSANSAFVRKGTKLKLNGGGGNYWGRFYPIV